MPFKKAQRPFRANLREVFIKGFTVMDIAEPLVSFDGQRVSADVLNAMESYDFDLVGIRKNGRMAGYVRRESLGNGPCGDFMEEFHPSEVVLDTTPLLKVIRPLSKGTTLFVSILYDVGAVVTPWDLQKPAVRMVAFGGITLLEMGIVQMIGATYPEDSWKGILSENRVRKAELLLGERLRRNEQADLLECLQFGDKSDLAARDAHSRQVLGLNSKTQAEKVFSDLEMLRDNLAHGQYLQARHLKTVARLAVLLDKSLNALDPFGGNLKIDLHPDDGRTPGEKEASP